MEQKEIKIILSGLDNAGKTSMLVGLKRMYDFEDEIKNLLPTIRIDYFRRKFLNMNLNVFDMGGQDKFRKSYLKRPIYFEDVNVLIYLIDIQDEVRFSESLAYLGEVLGILRKNQYPIEYPIFICFSKSDYNLINENMEDYLSRMLMIKELIKKFEDFKFEYYSTSIYNLYTIIRMISAGLYKFLEGYDKIQKLMEEFAETTDVKQVLFFDHTGLVISDYFMSGVEDYELQNKIDGIISGHLEFFGRLEDQNLEITSTRGADGEFMNVCYQTQLFNNLNLTQEEVKIVKEKKDKGDPYYANYYFSMIVPLENSVPAENKIPETLDQLKSIIQEIIEIENK